MWDEIHVQIARAWLAQETRGPQTPEEVEREALQSQPWRALQNWIMSSLDTRGTLLQKARRKLIIQYCGSFKMQPSSTSILDAQLVSFTRKDISEVPFSI
jgi:hypothetical protein